MEKDIKIVVKPIPIERLIEEAIQMGRREAILDMEKQVADAYKGCYVGRWLGCKGCYI